MTENSQESSQTSDTESSEISDSEMIRIVVDALDATSSIQPGNFTIPAVIVGPGLHPEQGNVIGKKCLWDGDENSVFVLINQHPGQGSFDLWVYDTPQGRCLRQGLSDPTFHTSGTGWEIWALD